MVAHCGGDIYSRRKLLFSSFGEHTAVCGPSVRQAVARPHHRQSVCIHNIHVAATSRPSVLGSATMRNHMWLNKVASVLGALMREVVDGISSAEDYHCCAPNMSVPTHLTGSALILLYLCNTFCVRTVPYTHCVCVCVQCLTHTVCAR